MATHRGDLLSLLRVITVRNHRDDLITGACSPDKFGRSGGQRCNPAGRLFKADFLSSVVGGASFSSGHNPL